MILVNGQWHWNCKPEAIVDATFGQSWHLCQQPLPPCVRCNKRSIVLFIDSAACASGRWSLDVAIHWNTFVVQHVETLRETQQIRQSWCLMILFCEMAMFMGSTGCRGKIGDSSLGIEWVMSWGFGFGRLAPYDLTLGYGTVGGDGLEHSGGGRFWWVGISGISLACRISRWFRWLDVGWLFSHLLKTCLL